MKKIYILIFIIIAVSHKRAQATALRVPPPAAPTVSASVNTADYGSIIVSWPAVSGATSYRLDVSVNSSFSTFVTTLTGTTYNNFTVSTTSRTITGLPAGPYYVRARAVNASGPSVNSSVPPAVTVVSGYATSYTPYIYGVPGNVTTSGFTLPFVIYNGTGTFTFNIQICATSNYSAVIQNLTVQLDGSGIGGPYPIINLSPGSTYYARVRTQLPGGTWSPYSPFDPVTTLVPPPPVAGTATNVTETSFTANWTGDDFEYELQVSTNGTTFTPLVSGYNQWPSAETYTVTGLTPSTIYYYRCRGTNTPNPAFSNTVSVTTLSGPPVIMPGTINSYISSTTFYLMWEPAIGAVSYRIDIARDAGFSDILDEYDDLATSGTLYNEGPYRYIDVQNLEPETIYYIRIRSVRANESVSANSIVATYTTLIAPIELSNRNVIISRTLTGIPDYQSAHYPGQTSVTYYDGLGRPEQQVNWKASPGKNDIIQPIVYDEFNREPIKYLPYTADNNTGSFRQTALDDQAAFYAPLNEGPGHSKTVFENAPLNRPIEQGAPGTAWQPDGTNSYTSADHTVKFSFEMNRPADGVIVWAYTPATSSTASSIKNDGNFSRNQLFKTKTKDENGNEIIEFKDKEGRVVLKKVQITSSEWAETYYVYDDFGNLVLVLPPEAVRVLKGS